MKKISKKTAVLLLLAIMIAGVFLRVYGIDKESMGIDEIVTYTEVLEDSVRDIINKVELREGIPPLYSLVLKAWSLAFGNSLLSLRMFSALFSFLTVILVFFLAELIFRRKTISLLAMLFSAVFISEVVLAQEARFYAFFGFFVLLSFYLFFRFVKSKERKTSLVVLLALCNLLLLYTNYLALMVFFIQYFILIHFFLSKENERMWLWSSVVCIVFALPSFWLNFKQMLIIYPRKPAFFLNLGFPSLIASLAAAASLSIQIIASIFLAIVFYFYRKSGKLLKLGKIRISDTAIAIVLVMAFILMLLFKDYFTRSFSIIRYAMFCAFFAYILFSYFLVNMKSKKLAALIIGLFLIINSLLLVEFFSKPQKMEWQNAIDYIKPEQDDYLVFSKGSYYVIAFDYHTKDAYNNRIALIENDGGIAKVISAEQLKNSLSTVNDFWLIAPKMKGKPIEHKKLIEAMYTLADYKKLRNLELYRYVKKA